MQIPRELAPADAPPTGQMYNPDYDKSLQANTAIKGTLIGLSITLIVGTVITTMVLGIIALLPIIGVILTSLIAVPGGLASAIGAFFACYAAIEEISYNDYVALYPPRFISIPEHLR